MVHLFIFFTIPRTNDYESIRTLMLVTAFYYFVFWIVAVVILSFVNRFRLSGYTNKCLAKMIIAMMVLYGLLSLAGPIISIIMFAIDKD